MNIFCISGGNYNSIYLNNLIKKQKIHLLLINFNVFNDVNNNFNSFFEEILFLQNKFKCVIVVGVKINKHKYFVVCKNNFFNIFKFNNDYKLAIKKHIIKFGVAYGKQQNINVIFSTKEMKADIKMRSKNRFYIFVCPKSVTLIAGKKIIRKFNKCSKFILK